ncbi:hypothetical protein J5N97_003108 [Dioscorea zingiberensis]|uniref:Telomere-associated protein Rif1 N-terminal domain-containing protein n=1 Tax=Dioscorea zingiberensis TaxID=325984 RepID=A0A9D5HR05_9LILI|nr:hypothetical protein J5N97_003108 [Dioscorea zingiberensis]
MIEMVHVPAQKIHIIRAWGWYIHLLGSDAVNRRKLINSLLKVPEKTFSSPDPQIQIASLVAWESLVDVLLSSSVVDIKAGIARGTVVQQIRSASSLYDKRDSEHQIVNHPSIANAAFWSILEMIFSMGPNNSFLWTTCLDLLEEFILAKTKDEQKELDADSASCSFDCKESMKIHPISWLPWELNSLDFYLKLVGNIVIQSLVSTVTFENRILALNGALRTFRSILQGVRVELKAASTHNDITKFCIDTIFKFTKKVCEDTISKKISGQCNDTLCVALKFVETIRDELDPSILSSTLYRIALDISYIKDLQSFAEIKYLKSLGSGFRFLAYMDLVSPMVYTTLLHISLVAQSVLSLPGTDDISLAMQSSLHLIFSYSPLVNLHAVICFLYMHIGKLVQGEFCWLKVWRVISNGLEENIFIVDDSNLKNECDNADHRIVYWLLCYPFFMCFSLKEGSTHLGKTDFPVLCQASPYRELKLEFVMEVWRSLFNSSCSSSACGFSAANKFVEGLSELLNGLLDENNSTLQKIDLSKEKPENIYIFTLFGEVAICLMEHAQVLDYLIPKSTANNEVDGCCSPIVNTLGFVVRILDLAFRIVKMNPRTDHAIIGRIFAAMATLVHRFFLKKDIDLLMGIISDSLLQWLSLCASIHEIMLKGSIIYPLQCLWVEILDTLQKSQPPIIFNSLLLRIQASLLKVAFDHPHLPISDATILFWEATYGPQTNLHYPQCLVPVLHKLSTEGRCPKERLVFCTSNNGQSGLTRKRLRTVQHPPE